MKLLSILPAAVLLVVSCRPPTVIPTASGEPARVGVACAEAIRVSAPLPGDSVSNPLTVRGEAMGGWYFEGDFPIRLFDVAMNQIAVAPAPALGEWMTEAFVPFEVTFPPFSPAGPVGYVFLERANPSDDPAHSCSAVVPIRF